MTPAERALLLAVAHRMTQAVRGATTLRALIVAVEAEAEPPEPVKLGERHPIREGDA